MTNPRGTRTTRARDDGEIPIDLSTWTIPALDEAAQSLGDASEALMGAAKRAIAEALEAAMEDDVRVYLPFDYDEGSGDPLQIYVGLPLGKDDNEDPHWEFSLETLVDDIIDNNQQPGTNEIADADARTRLSRLALELCRLAEKIEDALAVGHAAPTPDKDEASP